MSVLLYLVAAGSAAIAADSAAYRFPGADKLKPEIIELIQPYWDCVLLSSKGLERSKESAEIVVKAAFQQCREKRLDLDAALTLESIMHPQVKAMRADDMLEKFDREIEGAAILSIVQMRAGKAE